MPQAMTSSVLDGVGVGCESPAPPAISPLTDADPGNREPSVGVPITNDNSTGNGNGHHHDPDPRTRDDDATRHAFSVQQQQQQHTDNSAVNGADLAKSNGDAQIQTQSALANNSHSQTESATPVTPAKSQGQHTIGDAMDLDAPMSAATATMDYTTSPGFDLYTQQNPSQLLMALARLSAATQPQMLALPPSTVRPSQVSLPPHALHDPSEALMQDAPGAATQPPPVEAPLESFARIEFADSVFQMTTYAVIIGRDQRALDQARRDERRHEDYQRRVRENEELGLPAPSPPTQDRGKFSKSYVSEEGGMLGPESDGDDNPRPSKRRKASGGAASGSGDSHQFEAAAGEQASIEEKNTALNRQYVSHTPGAAAVNLSALRPSPYYVPFIGIHSPGPNIASRTKAISREHLKVEFNQKDGVFEAIPLHKNGFFCEDVHYKDEKVVLRSGDRLQIKDVDFVFIINGVPRGKTGAEDGIDEDGVSSRRYSEGGKEMSFDFESSHDPERRSTSPEDVPMAMAAVKEDSDSELSEPADDIAEPEPEVTPEQDVMETIEKDPEAPPTIKPEMSLELLASLEPIIPKKRGPGRPPKNGIMSKREERLRKKAAMELAKKNMPQLPPGEPPVKRKVGRPRKHPLPENAPDRPEKRKYKPRKSKTGEEGEGSDIERSIKERRREKPKTPPLELDKADYTEEQLQKPPKNYGMLIDEVLTAAPPDGLTLKQIYKRIQMKYPYYYFSVDTKGWESSVRHNLIGNNAFKKNEETHLWSRVPGIDIDAGKKRTKATSPDHPTSMHTFGQHYSTSATPTSQMFHTETGMQQGYRSGSVPQRQGYPPGHHQAALGQHPQPQPGSQAMGAAAQQGPRQTNPAPTQMQGATPTPGYGNPAAAHQPHANAQATAYSSPYASRPLPAATAQPAGLANGTARQSVPHAHVPNPVNGLPRVPSSSAQTAPAGARPAPPAANGTPLTLKPAVAPELVRHVTNFKTTVTEQLSKRTSAAEAVAMSVINRGLGLAAESTVPEEESLEKIVLGVFESSRKNLGAHQSLHPGLVQALGNFKNNMIKTLEPKMGKLNAERLILSAVDRVLGFADRSTMPGPETDKKQYDEAENVLISAIQRVVTEHQRTLAAVASASAPQPPSRPGPPAASASAPNPMSTGGQAPASGPGVAYAAATSTNSGTNPVAPATASTYHAAAPARPPVSAASAPATKLMTTGVPAPAQVSRPPGVQMQGQALPHSPNAATAPARPQVPSTNTAQGSIQTLGASSGAPANPAVTQVSTPAANPVSTPGPVQAAARISGTLQPQSPAHALAQAQAQAAAQNASAQKPAQVQAPPTGPAPVAPRAITQPISQNTALATAAPKPPAPAQTPAISPPPAQSQAAAQGVAQGVAPASTQGLGSGAPVPDMAPTPAKGLGQPSAPAPAPAPAAATAAALNLAQTQTIPAATTHKPAQPSSVAAPVTAPAFQEKASPTLAAPSQAPSQKLAQSITTPAASGQVPSASQAKSTAALPPTTQVQSHSPTPPISSASASVPAPAAAQTATQAKSTPQTQPSASPVASTTAPAPTPAPAQAQTATPAPASQSPAPTPTPAPPAPMANMAPATTTPPTAPPPTPPPATATVAR